MFRDNVVIVHSDDNIATGVYKQLILVRSNQHFKNIMLLTLHLSQGCIVLLNL